MKKTLFRIFLCTLAGAAFASCENGEYLYRDTSSRIWLSSEPHSQGNVTSIADSLRFSFMLLDSDATESTVYFVAHLTGQAADVDREFKLEVVADSSNVSAGDYSIGATVMPAGKFEALVPVTVKRRVAGLDLTDAAGNVTARLVLRVVANENFLTGTDDGFGTATAMNSLCFNVIWCDFLTKPFSYSSFITSAIGPFSQARYKFFIDFTGKTEFTEYDLNSTTRSALQAALRQALAEYNNLADTEGRPHYKDDDGSDLTF
jgi:hypothetical protein